jgi:DNA-binding transcriptional MocR family regulator
MTSRYEAIAQRVALSIRSGLLVAGERLPSLRSVCESEQVSLMTALAAYRRLETLQLVEALPRSGYRVRLRENARLDRPAIARPRLVPAKDPREAILREVLAAAADPSLVPLGLGCPDPRQFPLASLRRVTGRLLAAEPELWTTYSLPPGSPELRRLIARRLCARGSRVHPDEVLITNGAMEALFLAVRALLRPGDRVAVEVPTFFGILDVVKSVGAQVLEVPGDPELGVDPERFVVACRRHRVRAAVLMPAFANPTGSLMSDDRKAKLAALLQRARVSVVEDDIYGELGFALRAPAPLWGHAQSEPAPCILVGSFSKTLLPAGRIGYLVAKSPWIERLTELKRVTTLATGTLPERLAAECVASGLYDRHLRRMIPRLQQNLRQLEHAVAQHFPKGTRTNHPQGGFMLWVELPRGCSAERLFWSARKAGISIIPGNVFTLASGLDRFVRLSAANVSNLDAAMGTLGGLARAQLDA